MSEIVITAFWSVFKLHPTFVFWFRRMVFAKYCGARLARNFKPLSETTTTTKRQRKSSNRDACRNIFFLGTGQIR